MIHDGAGGVSTVLDTKWKRLKSDAEDTKNGVDSRDMYQMYAYARRLPSAENVLLYPAIGGASPKVYNLHEEDGAGRIRIEFLDVSRDMLKERQAVLADVRRALAGPVNLIPAR